MLISDGIAPFSDVAKSLKSLSSATDFFVIFLYSMMRFVADKNKNEFTTAGNMATAAIISTPPTMAIAPYAAPNARAPESPGKIRHGIL